MGSWGRVLECLCVCTVGSALEALPKRCLGRATAQRELAQLQVFEKIDPKLAFARSAPRIFEKIQDTRFRPSKCGMREDLLQL